MKFHAFIERVKWYFFGLKRVFVFVFLPFKRDII